MPYYRNLQRPIRKQLPIREYKDEIMEKLRNNKVIVVIGHTGCGKSTQLPQMLYEEGYGENGIIACTQPRRFAAYSLAKRVSHEVGCKLGTLVGYKIRFEDFTNNRTRILYMTDGSLLMNRINSVRLSKYSAIMLDEVHERALQTDMLFGLLKQTIKEREDIKIIITSATLDADTFSKFFYNAPIIEVSGSMFDVQIIYRPIPERGSNKHVATIIQEIDQVEDEGDVLVFLSGKPEIEEIAKLLEKDKQLHVLPAHAELSTADLDLIHEDAPEGRRKVVLATNVAETSLTVEGIVHIVDQGFAKLNFYDGPADTNELRRVRCSQAEAQQRKGRAGRTKPGVCYRLYSEDTFENEMPKVRPPEISRANLTAMTLQIKSIGYNDVMIFDFLTPPNRTNLKVAHDHLHQLDALDDECFLTRKGRLMVMLPLDPKMSCSLMQACEEGCGKDVMMICAMLAAFNEGNIRKLSPILTNNSDLRDELLSDEGEHFALKRIFKKYYHHNNRFKYMERYQLNRTVMKEAEQVYHQMFDILKRQKISLESCGNKTEPVLKSLINGLFHSLSTRESHPIYRVIRDQKPAKLCSHLLAESALPSKIQVGTYLSKTSERSDRQAVCITVIPEEMDLTEYIQKFQIKCKHFGIAKEDVPEPFWLTEAKEWHSMYLETEKENVNLQKMLEQQDELVEEWQNKHCMIELKNTDLQTRLGNVSKQNRELEANVGNLQREKRETEMQRKKLISSSDLALKRLQMEKDISDNKVRELEIKVRARQREKRELETKANELHSMCSETKKENVNHQKRMKRLDELVEEWQNKHCMIQLENIDLQKRLRNISTERSFTIISSSDLALQRLQREKNISDNKVRELEAKVRALQWEKREAEKKCTVM